MNTGFLYVQLHSLTVFRALLDDPVIAALCRFLGTPSSDTAEAVSAYAAFVAEVYNTGAESFAEYVQGLVNDDENAYIRLIGKGEQPPAEMERCAQAEFDILQTVADLTADELCAELAWSGYLPAFPVGKVDLAGDYAMRCANVGRYGYGMYAKHRMFYVSPENKIVPVYHPDRTRLSSLVDYEREKQIIVDNTVALLEGKPAANILLTGDAGTGKSSTVKAVVNELHDRGLRILEVRKEQLHAIPSILDSLSSNPLKFILFIDDLSFQKDDDNFSALKAILEGSVSTKAQNVVVYATSNRRHLVKETFSDRDGDDIHRNDTMQEIISLSARFGIHITFQKPNKQTYLDIVQHLAAERGLQYDPDELALLAERFALDKGGRSARAAKQFVDGLTTAEN
ncbi:MAG: ATP-binding protein [Clostridia bacterium]|nr:ATP-binding protein [Clostridia bacterium]